ncbi:hypothetical protein [Mycobacterium sp. HNNTM2301]|uniref:hypothetical protein n=1 Tax=Mycobacterium hainanense TaxID=3289775 RepID=UPI0035A670A9
MSVTTTTNAVDHHFQGPERVIDRSDAPYSSAQDITVSVRGWQRPDGAVEREIVVDQLHSDDGLTVAHARQVARALIAAADEVEAAAASNGSDG